MKETFENMSGLVVGERREGGFSIPLELELVGSGGRGSVLLVLICGFFGWHWQ